MKLSKFLRKHAKKFEIEPEEFDFKEYDNYEVNVDEGTLEYDTCVRRPYYRLRGKPVSEEQAFEVIRRTDTFFHWEIDLPIDSDYIGAYHIRNFWFNRNHFPTDMGWIHADGTLGGNGITDKYPNFKELFFEMLDLLKTFPYLDFVLAITNWNEIPDEMWRHLGDDIYDEIRKVENYEGFNEAIEIGFWVHDNQIDVLNSERAVEKYKEYEEKYAVADSSFYSAYYNMEKGIIPCDLEYLKKCIEVYGLNVEEELGKIPEYTWNPKYKSST